MPQRRHAGKKKPALLEHEHVRRGIGLFNSAAYFDAHEALEDAWRESEGGERLLLQAIMQAAVAMHHLRSRNIVGARGVMARCLRNLDGYPERCEGIELEDLRAQLRGILAQIKRGDACDIAPQLRLKE